MNDKAPQEQPEPQPKKRKSKASDIAGRRNPARNAIDNLWTTLVTIPLVAVSSILVAKALGPDLRGVLGFLFLFRSFAVPAALLGYPAAVTYYISSRKYEVRDVAASAIFVGLLHGLIATGAVLLLAHYQLLGEVAHTTDRQALITMACVMPMQSAFLINTCILLGDSRFALQNRLIMGRDVGLSVAMIIVVWWLGKGIPAAVNIIAVLATVGFLTSTLGLWILYKPRLRLDFKYLRQSYFYGLRAWGGSVANQANLRLDQLVLAFFCPAAALGWYAIAARLTQRLWMLPNALSVIVFNKVSAHKSKEESSQLIDQVHRPLIWMMVVLAILLGLVAWWVIPLPFLYGAEYQPAAIALALLLPGSLAVTSSRIVGRYFSGKGRPEVNAVSSVLGAIASAIFYPTLIITFSRSGWFASESLGGLVGASIACTIVYMVVGSSKVWFYRRSIAPTKAHLYLPQPGDYTWMMTQIRRGLGLKSKEQPAAESETGQQSTPD